MAVLYLLLGIAVVVVNIGRLPEVVAEISTLFEAYEQALVDWVKELRARAYVEMRDPP